MKEEMDGWIYGWMIRKWKMDGWMDRFIFG
jgi:hypothetical protein